MEKGIPLAASTGREQQNAIRLLRNISWKILKLADNNLVIAELHDPKKQDDTIHNMALV